MRDVLVLLLLTSCVDGDPMLERDELEPAERAQRGAFGTFIACLRYDDFVASNLQRAWAMAPEAAFDQLKHRMYVQLQYFRYDRTNDVVDVNETTLATAPKAVADATYDLYVRTLVRLETKTCEERDSI